MGWTRSSGWTAPPTLGQHTRAILTELGYDEPALESLAAGGAI